MIIYPNYVLKYIVPLVDRPEQLQQLIPTYAKCGELGPTSGEQFDFHRVHVKS